MDPLKQTIAQFRAWRAAKNYRADVKTRLAAQSFMGKSWAISKDHKKAYFHAAEDFAAPVWDSKKDNRRGNSGYYADNFQNGVVRWCVVKIAPANKKHNREALFAPVTYCTEWEGVTLHLDSAGSDDDARRWGEHEAEREAEAARQGDAEDQAEQQIEEARKDIHDVRLDTKRMVAGLRASTLAPAICAHMMEYIKGNREQVHKYLRRITDLRENCWVAVE